jgi:hypothetical protein
MKFHHLAAATLLLSSSALALAASDYGDAATTHEASWSEATAHEMQALAGKASLWKSEQAIKPVKASAMSWDSDAVPLDKPEATIGDDPDLDLAEKSIDTSAEDIETALAAEGADPAMGDYVQEAGLSETAPMEMASADLAPRPASQNYPACEPGPGDDSCIQLYEPGVRTALASWEAPTGGLSDGNAVAMGGPLDEAEFADVAAEVDEAGNALASHGDHELDAALGEETDGKYAEAS